MTKKKTAVNADPQPQPQQFDKLNLGSGAATIAGYDNIDIQAGRDCRSLSDYADESATEIRASHILEHFPHPQTVGIVREWARVLKPGGKMFLAVPDIDKIIDAYEGPHAAKLPVESVLMGGHTTPHDGHAAMFNRRKLESAMRMAGLIRVESWPGDKCDTSSHPVSLNLVGTKPAPETEPPKVTFVLSCPRLGFNDMWNCVVEGIRTTPNAVLHKVTGAYWGQCIERGMQHGVSNGSAYVIALDYDSLYSAEDVAEMLYLARSYPEADALVPLQAARGWDTPLCSITDPATGKLKAEFDTQDFANPVHPIETGHFGMTLFRAESLKRFPHPWFYGQPNTAGEWGDGKIDDDIAFWRKWKALGFSAMLANRVCIGHVEPMVKWPGKDWKTVHQALNNYNDKGKPAGVWQ